MCIFFRFTDGDSNLRKDFIDFIPLIRTTRKTIATAIKQTLEKLGLDLAIIRDQG